MNLICKIFGHKYQIVQKFDLHVAKLKCKRCNYKFGINTNVQALLPWDNELEELHNGDNIMWAENELERILKMTDGEWICLRQHGEGGVFIERYKDEYTASEMDEYGGKQTGHMTFKRKNLDKMFELIDKWT